MTSWLRKSDCGLSASKGSRILAMFSEVVGCTFTRITPKCSDSGNTTQSPKWPSKVTSCALVPNGACQDVRVVGSSLASFQSPEDIMSVGLQPSGKFGSKHLVEIESHSKSGRFQCHNVRMNNGMAGIAQSRLNVLPPQFRIPVQDCVPGFAFSQLFQKDCHWNAGVFDDGLTTAHAGIDFNAFVHEDILALLQL